MQIIYEMFKEKYTLVGKQWYYYNGIIWERNEECVPTGLLLGVGEVNGFIKELYNRHFEEDNLSDAQIKKLFSVTQNLCKKLSKNNEDISFVNANKR